MQTLARSYSGLQFIVKMNLNRVLTTGFVVGSLYFSAYVFVG